MKTTQLLILSIVALATGGCSVMPKGQWSQESETTTTPVTAAPSRTNNATEIVTYTVSPGDEDVAEVPLQAQQMQPAIEQDSIGNATVDLPNESRAMVVVPPTRDALNRQNSQAANSAHIPNDTVVFFDFDSSSMDDTDKAIVTAHATYLKQNPDIQVRLEGHADERGSREYNLGLGELRARAVHDLLLLQGARQSQLFLISYGEERPRTIGNNEAAWQQNRRVEFVY